VLDSALCLPLVAEFPAARRWVIAYSGGMDSHVLLHLCTALRAGVPDLPPLVALHVNHGVQPEADGWTRHCAAVCADLGLPCAVRPARIDGRAGTHHPEQALRAARYRVFEEFCEEGDLLLLAHHRDDQAETVLQRLVRGAGVAGLAGMPGRRPCGAATLCRPLLDVPRGALHGYARARGLRWIEDPSNASQDPDRNFLRLRVLPLIAERWPGAAASMARAARNLSEAAEICAARTSADMAGCRSTDRFGQPCLELAPWRELAAAHASAVLRAWLQEQGAGPASEQSLATLREEVIGARADAQPSLLLGTVVIRRYRDRLYALSQQKRQAAVDSPIAPGAPCCLPGVGRVELALVRDGGVRPGRDYRIRTAAPGTCCRPAGRPRKSLKQLAQENGVPPWLRSVMPMLYVDGELAAVADLCVCEGFVAPAGSPALRLRWQPQALTT